MPAPQVPAHHEPSGRPRVRRRLLADLGARLPPPARAGALAGPPPVQAPSRGRSCMSVHCTGMPGRARSVGGSAIRALGARGPASPTPRTSRGAAGVAREVVGGKRRQTPSVSTDDDGAAQRLTRVQGATDVIVAQHSHPSNNAPVAAEIGRRLGHVPRNVLLTTNESGRGSAASIAPAMQPKQAKKSCRFVAGVRRGYAHRRKQGAYRRALALSPGERDQTTIEGR